MLDTPVSTLDLAQARITLSSGRELSYDRLLLTTGAEPRRIELPGADLGGIHYLRTLADCEELRATLERGPRVAVIGAGWIGAEVAASSRERGADVTIIERSALPLVHVLGEEVGRVYRDIHRDHGVELITDTGVAAFEGGRAVKRVKTRDGRTCLRGFR
jgi:3-phenylpropionate/trans-cinnamate dioxygenase ferredoxin reductase subunit